MLRKGTKPKWIGQWPQKPKKKRKCSVLTKHVKEYIKKEEEEDNKKKNENKNKQRKTKEKQITPSQITVFLLAVTRFTSFRTFDRDKLIYTRLGYTIIGDDAYLLGFK